MMPRFSLRAFLSAFALGFFSLCASAQIQAGESLKDRQEKEITRFIERLEACHHWGGEEAYDAARKKEIISAVQRLGCDRLNVDEARLRNKYAKNQMELKRLEDATKLFE